MDTSIGCNLEFFANNIPNKTALHFNDKQISYKEFYTSVKILRTNLKLKAKETVPQKVGLLIGNEPAFLELFFAVITLGWIAIPFDPKWSKREADRVMNTAKPDLLITNKSFQRIASYRFEDTLDIEKMYLTPESTADFTYEILQDKSFYIGFTSGSTGDPKGFIRNQKSWLASFAAGEQAFQYGKNDTIFAPGPLCHSLSLFGATHAIHIGASFYLMSNFSASKTVDLINEEKITVFYAVPTMLHQVARLARSTNKNITILSSGAKLTPKIRKSLQDIFPVGKIYEYYGASELSYATYSTDQLTKKYPNSVGKPFPGVTITIRDNEGSLLNTNEIGSIYIHSNFLFTGYINNREATKDVLTPYGANIGDVGFLNEDGILTVIGREKNMIIHGGQNVYPEEVEKTIKEIDGVEEAVVLGLEDEKWGQIIIALIIWKKANGNKHVVTDRMKQIKQHCKAHLSPYKRPRRYYTVTSLPYTLTGKISRNKIEANISRWIR